MSFDPATLFQAGQAGAWYDPSDLSTLWQDTAATVPVTAAGQSVARVDDKSGNGKHLTQGTAANCPIFQVDGSAHPYLLFDGLAHFLSASLSLSFPFDRISALRQVSWASGRHLFSGGSAGVLYQSNASPKLRILDGATGPMNDKLPVGANGIVTERHVANAQQIAVNNGAYVSGDAGSVAPLSMTVGAKPNLSLFANIRLYGFLARAGSLSPEEITDARAWLAAKCGVTLARRAARHSGWI